MIIKIISREEPQRESDVAAMVKYVRAERPEDAGGDKRVPGYGGNTFGAAEDEGGLQLRHMLELMRSNPGCRRPMLHGMISWAEGDAPERQGGKGEKALPSPEQVDEAVRIWVAELGLDGLDMLWAVHGNTANAHVHVLVCRVEPETGKVRHLVPYRKACQRAKARIAAAQGLRPCARDLYIPAPDGSGGIVPNPERWRSQAVPSLTPEAAALEHRLGVKSVQSLLQERVPEALEKAGKRGWQAFHAVLAEAGAAVKPTGRGLVFFMGKDGVKASNVGRKSCTRKKLEKTLGAWEPAPAAVLERAADVAAAMEPEPVAGMPRELVPWWEDFIRARETWLADERRLTEERRADRRRLRDRLQEEMAEAGRLLKETRNRHGWRILPRGAGEALRMALRARGDARRRVLRERLTAEAKGAGRRFPDSFAAWLDEQGQASLAALWRRRGRSAPLQAAEQEAPRPGM